MERRAKLLVLVCLGVVMLGSLMGLLWMSMYAVK
jgi:hypothetical protein